MEPKKAQVEEQAVDVIEIQAAVPRAVTVMVKGAAGVLEQEGKNEIISFASTVALWHNVVQWILNERNTLCLLKK